MIRGRARNFCLGGPNCNFNIFIKTTPTYTYTHAFLLYTHNKKSLVILIKIMFGGNLSKNNIHSYYFYSEFLKNFIFDTIIKFYTKVRKKSFNWTNEIFKNMNDQKLGGTS